MKQLFVVVMLAGITSTVNADPIRPGVLVWSGTYTDTWDTFDNLVGPPSVDLTGIGAETSQGGMGYAPGLTFQYTVTTGFTVTSAGDFLLSSSGNYGIDGSTCNPGGCGSYPGETLDANFTASVGILDSGSNSVLDQSLSASGSAPFGDCSFGDCFANITLGDIDSGVVDLAAGNYSLVFNYYGYNNSPGDNFGSGDVNANLVPNTPEPNELAFMIGGIAALILLKKFRRHSAL